MKFISIQFSWLIICIFFLPTILTSCLSQKATSRAPISTIYSSSTIELVETTTPIFQTRQPSSIQDTPNPFTPTITPNQKTQVNYLFTETMMLQNPHGCIPARWEREIGIVEWVVDGDSIVIRMNGQLRSVRYIGIDAPEEVGATEKQGPAASRRNRELVEGRIIELFRDEQDKNENGQLLRYVLVDNLFINYQIIIEGLAIENSITPNDSCQNVLTSAQNSARENGLGIWNQVALGTISQYTPTSSQTNILIQGSPTVVVVSSPTEKYLTPTPNSTINNKYTNTPASTRQVTNANFTVNPPTQTPDTEETATITPTDNPTISSTPTPTLIQGQSIAITDIFYSGNFDTNESDEYIEIKNFSNQAIEITGWLLYADTLGVDYLFPEFTMAPGQICRIYTNEDHSEYCNFSFESDIPIWSNDQDDCGFLYNLALEEVSQFCYP